MAPLGANGYHTAWFVGRFIRTCLHIFCPVPLYHLDGSRGSSFVYLVYIISKYSSIQILISTIHRAVPENFMCTGARDILITVPMVEAVFWYTTTLYKNFHPASNYSACISLIVTSSPLPWSYLERIGLLNTPNAICGPEQYRSTPQPASPAFRSRGKARSRP